MTQSVALCRVSSPSLRRFPRPSCCRDDYPRRLRSPTACQRWSPPRRYRLADNRDVCRVSNHAWPGDYFCISRPTIPSRLDMKFAGGFAESRDRQNGRHHIPWNFRLAIGTRQGIQRCRLESRAAELRISESFLQFRQIDRHDVVDQSLETLPMQFETATQLWWRLGHRTLATEWIRLRMLPTRVCFVQAGEHENHWAVRGGAADATQRRLSRISRFACSYSASDISRTLSNRFKRSNIFQLQHSGQPYCPRCRYARKYVCPDTLAQGSRCLGDGAGSAWRVGSPNGSRPGTAEPLDRLGASRSRDIAVTI